MATGFDEESTFTNSCLPILYRDLEVGNYFIDPCSCKHYYECDKPYNIIRRSCADGTLYDHEEAVRCSSETTIVHEGKCSLVNPWQRCAKFFEDVNIEELRDKCLSSPPKTTISPQITNSDGTGVPPTVVVAIVVPLVIIILVIAAILFVFLRKRKQSNLGRTSFKSRAENLTYFADRNNESIYDRVARKGEDMNTNGATMSFRPALPSRPPGQSYSLDSRNDVTSEELSGYVEPTSTLEKERARHSVVSAAHHEEVEYSEIFDEIAEDPARTGVGTSHMWNNSDTFTSSVAYENSWM